MLQKPQGFLLPGLAAVSSLVILLLGTFIHPGPIAIAIAAVTLAVVGPAVWRRRCAECARSRRSASTNR